jgi:hypothetical protein
VHTGPPPSQGNRSRHLVGSSACSVYRRAPGRLIAAHSNCRHMGSIKSDEEELPKVGGIPQSLRTVLAVRYDLEQPKKPMRKRR